MGVYIKNGNTLLAVPSSLCVELTRSMGCDVFVPNDYNPDGWDGEWSYDVPEGVNWEAELRLRLFRVFNSRPKLEKLAMERFNPTGNDWDCRAGVNGTFKILDQAGFEFGKDWEDQPQEFHVKLAAIIDDLANMVVNGDRNKRQESEYFIVHPQISSNTTAAI